DRHDLARRVEPPAPERHEERLDPEPEGVVPVRDVHAVKGGDARLREVPRDHEVVVRVVLEPEWRLERGRDIARAVRGEGEPEGDECGAGPGHQAGTGSMVPRPRIQLGSTARLSATNCAMTSGPTMSASNARLSLPIPCSAETVPPWEIARCARSL